MSDMIPTLKTDRLILRPFDLTDAPVVQTLAGASEVAATTLNMPHPYHEGLAESWISRHHPAAAAGTAVTWAIVRTADATLLGAITLSLVPAHSQAELGYWLGVPYWNQGYITEAVRRVTAFAFAERAVHRVQAGCFPRNGASARVMEKAGMQYEGVLRGYVRKGEIFEDVAMYAVVRSQEAHGSPN